MKALVTLISAHVVAALLEGGYPALTDGRILLGRQYVAEGSAPPRIVFVPMSAAFSAKDTYSSTGLPSAAQTANPSLATDTISFEVHCWGAAPDQDPDDDFDYTEVLYQQVIRSVSHIARGACKFTNGSYTNSKANAGQMVRDGDEFVFGVTLDRPITTRVVPFERAPSDVAPEITDTFTSQGLSGPGCEDP